MALINCTECNKEISDKAASCPNCGAPLNSTTNPPSAVEELQFPILPADLAIGKQIVNWGGDSAFEGIFDVSENAVNNIPNGKIKVILHTHGLRIANFLYLPILDIHNSQIISIKQTTNSELINMDKSVIGRAAVGALILGPLGAVIGGMSGVGTKQKMQEKSFLVLNYWDIKSKAAQTLLVDGDKFKIAAFIKRNQKEENINKTEDRKAEPRKKGWFGVVLLPIAVGLMFCLCG